MVRQFVGSTLLTALSPSKDKLTVLFSTLHFVSRQRRDIEGRLKQTLAPGRARLGVWADPKGAKSKDRARLRVSIRRHRRDDEAIP